MALSKIKTGSIADDAVTSTKIATGGIATLDMADGSVTSLKIADGAIGTADLGDGSVTPAKLSTGGPTWNSNGNIGLFGASAPAWGPTSGSVWKAVQLGTQGAIYTNNDFIRLSLNVYGDTSYSERYLVDDHASQYIQASGMHSWMVAPSGTAGSLIPWSTALTIDNSGVMRRTLSSDSIGYQLKGSYTGNPTLIEFGQSSSDGYLTVKDAVGNTSYITGYPVGTTYFSSAVAVGGTGLGGGAAKFSVNDGISHSSGFRNHSSFVMPNMTGGSLSVGIGKSASTYNLGKIVYNHAGDANTSNSVGIGFWDKDNILVTYATGSVWIGDSTPVVPTGSNRLLVNNWTTGGAGIIAAVNRSGGYHAAYVSASNPGFDWQFGKGAQTNTSTDFEWGTNGGGGTVLFRITSGGNIFAAGSVNGSSKNFVIDHPLPEKKDTHYLVHTSTESPTADLIYRGKVNLVAGKATINIDEESTMTNGTFEAMLHNVQCFTSNESDWVHVRGKVEGNILTIEAQDPTATSLISWMVIGERKDEAMKKAIHTDENGKIIVEPLKADIEYDSSKDPTNPDSPDYDPSLKPIPVQEEQAAYVTDVPDNVEQPE